MKGEEMGTWDGTNLVLAGTGSGSPSLPHGRAREENVALTLDVEPWLGTAGCPAMREPPL